MGRYYLCYILFYFLFIDIRIISLYVKLIIYCRTIATAVELQTGLFSAGRLDRCFRVEMVYKENVPYANMYRYMHKDARAFIVQ